MPIWERLRRLFRSSAEKPVPIEERPTVIKPRINKPLPGLINHPLQHLFAEDQHTCTMLNSITLSSDMKTLYLIDNGRAIPFDLTVPEGVVIGLVGEQLTVATGASKMADEVATAPVEGLMASRSAAPAKTTFKVTDKSQYTVTYNAQEKALGVIGVGDIIMQLQSPDQQPCEDYFVQLSVGKAIYLRNNAGTLELELKVA